jgi:hypothetical protein
LLRDFCAIDGILKYDMRMQKRYAQVSKVEERQYTAWETPVEARVIKPDLMVVYK